MTILIVYLLLRLVYEIPTEDIESDENTDDIIPWNHPSLWKYQVNITVTHLRQKLCGYVTSDEGM